MNYREKMTALCKSIPTVANCDGVEPWDQERFAAAQRGRSTSEKQAASFVLTVWSGGKHRSWSKLPEFDFALAASLCDREVRQVIADFLMDPWWP